MDQTNKPSEERCIELEKRLHEIEQECAYYRSIAVNSGKRRLREIQQLTQLINDYKEAEEKIRILCSAVEQSIDGIAVMDMSYNYYYVNEVFAGMHGFDTAELIGMPDDVLNPDDGGGSFRVQREQTLADGCWSGESKHLKKDRTTFPVFISATLLKDYRSEPTSILYVVRDITEQKRLENCLQNAQKMEAIGLLAGGVAHDLNNILAGLIGYPEVLLLDIPKRHPMREPLQTIQKSGEKAAAIVTDLLTLSRQGITGSGAVDLNRVISEYLESPECNTLKSYNPEVEIIYKPQTDLPPVSGLAIHLHKVVMNLVSNAAQAMPRGGRLFIITESLFLEEGVKGYEDIPAGHYTLLIISDTGEGIAEENIEKIFEPFYTKRAMGRMGTGLGMSVVWATVKDHGGYIDIQSELGQGTTFLIYLPISGNRVHEEESFSASLDDYLGKGESILVVDDVSEQRDVATRMLKRLGYSVIAVNSGEEALSFLKGRTADIVILDMIMEPCMDGLETYRKILDFHPNQKAVLVSGYSETDNILEAQRLGAGPFVRKPYSLEELGLAVRLELDKV